MDIFYKQKYLKQKYPENRKVKQVLSGYWHKLKGRGCKERV
jgi:hypothetical protein